MRVPIRLLSGVVICLAAAWIAAMPPVRPVSARTLDPCAKVATWKFNVPPHPVARAHKKPLKASGKPTPSPTPTPTPTPVSVIIPAGISASDIAAQLSTAYSPEPVKIAGTSSGQLVIRGQRAAAEHACRDAVALLSTHQRAFTAVAYSVKHALPQPPAATTGYSNPSAGTNAASDIATALASMPVSAKVTGLSSSPQLVISGSTDAVAAARSIVEQLDRALPQVVIDVNMWEIDRSAAEARGFRFPDVVQFGASTAPPTAPILRVGGFTLSQLPLNLLGQLQSLQTRGIAYNLGNPRLVTVSGRTASVSFKQYIPVGQSSFNIITGQLSPAGFATPIPVGVTLDVTPVVVDEARRRISMLIHPRVDSFSGVDGSGNPIISSSEMVNTVIVNAGEGPLLLGELRAQLTYQQRSANPAFGANVDETPTSSTALFARVARGAARRVIDVDYLVLITTVVPLQDENGILTVPRPFAAPVRTPPPELRPYAAPSTSPYPTVTPFPH